MLLIDAEHVFAQTADSTGARTIASVRSGVVGQAHAILAQRDRLYPAATLDSLADALVAFVLSDNPGSERSGSSQHIRAIHALSEAASAGARRPYQGAGERLFQIAQRAESPGVRGAAIYSLTLLVDTTAALQLLRRIAVSEDLLAVRAIDFLWTAMGTKGGVAVLRELALSGGVTQPLARQYLDQLARAQGWR